MFFCYLFLSLLVAAAAGAMVGWWLCRSSYGPVTVNDLDQLENRFMATEAQILADVKTANARLRKLINDTAGLQPAVDALKAKIVELEAIIAAGGTIGQELVDAVAETKALTQTVDDNVPELPAAPGEPISA